ncbi:unnamed protein product [Rhizoctonia solani]|uniref:Uncharacterized protein n=1 Tax=Rhizoctonia solani TaxID=456999 RepID=A0A8H2XTR1_9AGAM|nr:unnamed protein product [Rhizoctonia solani]
MRSKKLLEPNAPGFCPQSPEISSRITDPELGLASPAALISLNDLLDSTFAPFYDDYCPQDRLISSSVECMISTGSYAAFTSPKIPTLTGPEGISVPPYSLPLVQTEFGASHNDLSVFRPGDKDVPEPGYTLKLGTPAFGPRLEHGEPYAQFSVGPYESDDTAQGRLRDKSTDVGVAFMSRVVPPIHYIATTSKTLEECPETNAKDFTTSIENIRPQEPFPPAQPEDIITGAMSSAQILKCLTGHGCRDVSKSLDISHVTEYPVSTGGDVYCATFRNGDRVGVKCVRMLVDQTAEGEKFLKHAEHEL